MFALNGKVNDSLINWFIVHFSGVRSSPKWMQFVWFSLLKDGREKKNEEKILYRKAIYNFVSYRNRPLGSKLIQPTEDGG